MARRCHAAGKRSAALSPPAGYNAAMRKRPGWRRRRGLAWLGIVALLINALLPAALSAVPAAGAGLAAGMCGHPPDRSPLLPGAAVHQCPLCCLVAAPSPPPAAGLLRLRLVIAAVAAAAAAPSPSPYRAAQPRGPPDRA